jgi:hypothetical protein
MKEAREILQELAPGWEIVDEDRAAGRRWPWCQVLGHLSAPMWVQLWGESLMLRHIKFMDVDERGWQFWWRVIKRFAKYPCVVYDNDESAIVATSMSAAKAKRRYGV